MKIEPSKKVFQVCFSKLLLLIFAFFPLLNVMGSYAFYSMDDCCEKNGEVFADLLYWHVGEVGTIPNSTISTKFDPNLVSKLNLNNLDFQWDLGYRIGGRYCNIGCDEWGISLYYTWYRTEAKNNGSFDGFVGIPSGFPLTGTLSDADFLNLFWLFAAHSFHARWDLHYNIFDFQVDRTYWVSSAVSLRPYLGLKGGWINQNIHIASTYLDPLAGNLAVFANERLKHHFWGIGPSCGLDSAWCLGQVGRHSFYLFADLSSAFMWSFWSFSDLLSIASTIHGELKSKHKYAGSLMFQNLLGLQWSVALNRWDSIFSLRVGFESQFWFDHLQIFNTYNGRQHNALTLQGGTFDLQFSY